MTMEEFTVKAQEAISTSQEMAIRRGNQEVDGEHLHAALIEQKDGLIPKLLGYMGVHLDVYQQALQNALNKLPSVTGSGASQTYLTRRFSTLLLHAQDEAKKFKDEYTSVEHLFIA
ncbi:MAG TPA: type VI secretion system ATPase TssH, partial [Ruminococcaceae bacterium]|nr:type VI secretion system ATPase TssH [Oscillospiraceae bacterium]